MTEAEYNTLKTFAQKDSLFTQVALVGSAVASDIDLDVHPVAAVSTQATLLLGGVLITAVAAASGLGTLPILATGLITSIAIEAWGLQPSLNKFFSGILGLAANKDGENVQLTGFQIYEAISEIIGNPDLHAEGEERFLKCSRRRAMQIWPSSLRVAFLRAMVLRTRTHSQRRFFSQINP